MAVRFTFGVGVVVVLTAGLLYLRLSQGPIQLSYFAQIAAEIINEDSEQFEIELGGLVLTMGEEGSPAGLRFVDFQVRTIEGKPLFTIPRLTAKFDTPELLKGRLRPTRIVLIRPEAQLLHTREGQFRFGLGTQPDRDDSAGDVLVGETPQLGAISHILDGLTGDAKLVPELSRLEEIIIYSADLTYENEASGRRWHTRRANLRVYRVVTGLLARLSVGLADGTEIGAGVVVNAERRRGGGGATRLDVRFDNLRPEHLAEQIDQMNWLRLFDAPLNGNLETTIRKDGRIEGLAGRISASAGRILALQEQGRPFDSIDLAFAYEAGLERMQVSELVLASKALDTRLSGFVDLARVDGGDVTGLAGQFEVAGMRVSVPEVFAEALNFDGGQIVARLNFDPMRIEVADAHLQTGDMIVDVAGMARAAADGWRTDMRAGGRNLSAEQLIRHWPLLAAGNARKWVDKNIHAGNIDEFIAQMRFGDGEPRLNLDFVFSGLVSSYLHDMTPISEARGRGSLTLNELHMTVESGVVTPVEGAPVRLDGSVVRLLNLQGDLPPGEMTIRAAGPTASILTLIDEEPLGLVGKLGLDPATIAGDAEVVADVGLLLIDELELEQVEVRADASLTSLRLPFRLPDGQSLDVATDAVNLSANTRELRLTGPILADGVPLDLEWGEFYGRGSNHRTIGLHGAVTPALLERFDLDNDYFASGRAFVDLLLTQVDSPDIAFELSADLAPAMLTIPEIGWTKAPGGKGRLKASGSFGDGTRVSLFNIDTDDLTAAGGMEFTPGGQLLSAWVERVQFRRFVDMAIMAKRMENGGLALRLSGKRLDLAMLDEIPDEDGEAGTRGDPGGENRQAIEFDLDELVITPKIIARRAIGTYRRDDTGDSVADLAGWLAGQVPFTAKYEKTGGEAAEILVQADDAGALLKAAELFSGAEGGRLKLKARIAPEEGAGLTGVVRIKDVRISGASTFKTILDEGGVKDAASAAEGKGLAFDKVRVPFQYRDGVMILGDSTAKGDLLAVKVEGTVDENTEEIDLVGVISPAYAVTGALDSIPLLGDILSGGKGEGILAMTFSVRGSLDEPEFSVNPLSLLTPGILRSIFSGRTSKPDEEFIESLSREID